MGPQGYLPLSDEKRIEMQGIPSKLTHTFTSFADGFYEVQVLQTAPYSYNDSDCLYGFSEPRKKEL